MKKRLTIPALISSLLSVTPVSANTVKSSSKASAPLIKDNTKTSKLMTKSNSTQSTQKIEPQYLENDLILNTRSESDATFSDSIKRIPTYWISSSKFLLNGSPAYHYYAFIKNNHPVILTNEYVTHHHQNCILMYYRGKEYYVSVKQNKHQTLTLEDSSYASISIVSFKQFNNEKDVMQQIAKSKQAYEQYQKQQQAKDQARAQEKIQETKRAAQKYYPMWKYLDQHPNQNVKSINIVLPNEENIPAAFGSTINNCQTLYLIGTSSQLDQAFNDIRNYHPNNQITILSNRSRVAIFNSNYDQINNPSDLYATGEKIQLNDQAIDHNTLKNQMIQEYMLIRH